MRRRKKSVNYGIGIIINPRVEKRRNLYKSTLVAKCQKKVKKRKKIHVYQEETGCLCVCVSALENAQFIAQFIFDFPIKMGKNAVTTTTINR